ncbi:hypothetical protein RND09_001775 [Morganella morganii]|nr:hypothetical protein [Morganella morganii]MDT5423033.1 hypothetical protein [Morganella morganii]
MAANINMRAGGTGLWRIWSAGQIRLSRRSLVSGDWQHRYWQLNRVEVA